MKKASVLITVMMLLVVGLFIITMYRQVQGNTREFSLETVLNALTTTQNGDREFYKVDLADLLKTANEYLPNIETGINIVDVFGGLFIAVLRTIIVGSLFVVRSIKGIIDILEVFLQILSA